MENGDHPGLGTEMLRVGADKTDRLGCCFEQDVVDHRLILQRDGGHRRRHGVFSASWSMVRNRLSHLSTFCGLALSISEIREDRRLQASLRFEPHAAVAVMRRFAGQALSRFR